MAFVDTLADRLVKTVMDLSAIHDDRELDGAGLAGGAHDALEQDAR